VFPLFTIQSKQSYLTSLYLQPSKNCHSVPPSWNRLGHKSLGFYRCCSAARTMGIFQMGPIFPKQERLRHYKDMIITRKDHAGIVGSGVYDLDIGGYLCHLKASLGSEDLRSDGDDDDLAVGQVVCLIDRLIGREKLVCFHFYLRLCTCWIMARVCIYVHDMIQKLGRFLTIILSHLLSIYLSPGALLLYMSLSTHMAPPVYIFPSGFRTRHSRRQPQLLPYRRRSNAIDPSKQSVSQSTLQTQIEVSTVDMDQTLQHLIISTTIYQTNLDSKEETSTIQ
jgi:hypothetical protein